jgi:hypothetical protein
MLMVTAGEILYLLSITSMFPFLYYVYFIRRLEVIVGTSVGMLYVLDGHSGFAKRFFPMQFHSIQAQVAVADILGGPHLEIIVADMAGTVAVVNVEGDILWDQFLSGPIPFTPTIADVNGDGQLDIIVATLDEKKKSHIWVLSGDNGRALEGFPMALPRSAAISGSIIIADLDAKSEYDNPVEGDIELTSFAANSIGNDLLMESFAIPKKAKNVSSFAKTKSARSSPHLIIPTFEGRVYILQLHHFLFAEIGSSDSKNPPKDSLCLQKLDFGGHLKAVPLLDDVTNDGYLDLVVGTLSGELSVYETSVPTHPSNTWSSFPKDHGNSFTFGDISISVNTEDKNRFKRYEYSNGKNISVSFHISDRRCLQKPCALDEYKIKILKGINSKETVFKENFQEPGEYEVFLPVNAPEKVIFHFILETKHGKYSEDFVSVTISTKFYVWLKYIVILPVLLFSSISLMKISEYI